MVRRERWYALDGQNQIRVSALQRTSGTRRLISLVILLVLVLILINQTSDTKKVEQVATAIGLLPSEPKTISTYAADVPESDSASTVPMSEQAIIEHIIMRSSDSNVQSIASIWSALLQKASPKAIDLLSRKFMMQYESLDADRPVLANREELQIWFADSTIALAQWLESDTVARQNGISLNGLRSEVTPPLPAESNRESSTLDAEKDVPESSLLTTFADWFRQHENWIVEDSKEALRLEQNYLRGLQIALDGLLLSRVLDNAPWKSAERLPFLRTWQRLDELRDLIATGRISTAEIAKVQVGQLMADSQELRGKTLAFEGTIVQCNDSGTILEAGFKKHDYKIVWLRPSEQSDQPVCVYVPANNIDGNVKLQKDTKIAVTGFFFKRLAYASQRGADIAPLLMAAYVAPANAVSPKTNNTIDIRRIPLAESEWKPPVDFMTPFAIVRQSLLKTLAPLNDPELASHFHRNELSRLCMPLLELERLAPEVDLLTSHQSKWTLDTNVALIRVEGLVTRIERVSNHSQASQGFANDFVYRCEISAFEPTDSGAITEQPKTTHLVICTTIPRSWLDNDGIPFPEINQPCVFSGVGISKTTETTNSPESVSSEPTLAWARSLEWKRPAGDRAINDIQLVPPLSSARQFLLSQGWNLTWLDMIQELETEPIKSLSAREYEPFYRLMRLARKSNFVDPRNTDQQASSERRISDFLGALMQRKKSVPKPVMERVAMHMRVVRVTRIQVADPGQAALLGSNHYYQMDAMADIGNRSYEIKTDKDPIVYYKEYPVTCVSIDAPSWLLRDDDSEDSRPGDSNLLAEESAEYVWYPRRKTTATGWFYRFWSYKTQEMTSNLGENKRQVGPLVVIDSIERGIVGNLEAPAVKSWDLTSIFTTALGVSGTLGIWWYVRWKLKRRQPLVSRKTELPPETFWKE